MKKGTALAIAVAGMLLAASAGTVRADRDYRNPQGEWVGGPHSVGAADTVRNPAPAAIGTGSYVTTETRESKGEVSWPRFTGPELDKTIRHK